MTKHFYDYDPMRTYSESRSSELTRVTFCKTVFLFPMAVWRMELLYYLFVLWTCKFISKQFYRHILNRWEMTVRRTDDEFKATESGTKVQRYF